MTSRPGEHFNRTQARPGHPGHHRRLLRPAATPTPTSTPSPAVNRRDQDGRPDLRHPEGPARSPSSASTSSATRRPATRSSAASCASTRASSSTAPGCAAARSASPRSASSRPWRSPSKPGSDDDTHRRPGGGEGEGHRHLPGGPRLLQRGELHLHGPGVAEQLPRLGPERVGLGADLRPALARQLSFFDPYFLDTNFLLVRGLLPRARPTTSTSSAASTGGNVSLGYHLLEDVHRQRGLHARVRGRGRPAQSFGGGAAGQPVPQRRDQLAAPVASPGTGATTASSRRKGFIHYGSVEFAPHVPGRQRSSSPATRPTRASTSRCRLGFVFKTNATIGYIQQLDSSNRRCPSPSSTTWAASTPCAATCLRSISPTHPGPARGRPGRAPSTGFSVGGNKQLIFNFELEFPIFEKAGIRGVLFYDAGNAFAPNERFFQDRRTSVPLGLFHSVGFGFRWFSPIGPAALRVGHPAHQAPGRPAAPLRVHHRQLLLRLERAACPCAPCT